MIVLVFVEGIFDRCGFFSLFIILELLVILLSFSFDTYRVRNYVVLVGGVLSGNLLFIKLLIIFVLWNTLVVRDLLLLVIVLEVGLGLEDMDW